MSEPIQSISQGNYILQGTVATSAGIVGDGSTQNPLRADETVLWEGTHGSYNRAITLSAAVSNFERIRILFGNPDNKYMMWQDIELMSASNGYFFNLIKAAGTVNCWIQCLYCSGNDTQIVPVSGKRMNFGNFTASTNITSIAVDTTYPDALNFRKIVGINRISGTP